MKTFRLFLGLVSTVLLIAMIWYAYAVYLSDPLADTDEYQAYIAQGLRAMEVPEPGWEVMVLAGSREVNDTREKIWEKWSQLQKWSDWGSPLVFYTVWRSEPDWKAGSKFEIVYELGWPLERTQTVQKIDQAVAPDRASYVSTEGPYKSYQIWKFEFQAGGTTRITSVEVLYGQNVGYLRPFVQKKWQKLYDQSLDGLVRYLQTP
jgi:hypothetical protein